MIYPERQVRAFFDHEHIRVYQAFNERIAARAVKAGTFVSPFKKERMTWIKPSFLWMMYRCGWAEKDENQTRVLAIDMKIDGFLAALESACLSKFYPHLHGDQDNYRLLKEQKPVRIQWDPERDLQLNPLNHRAIQIGLSGSAVHRYIDEWIYKITDITDFVRSVKATRDQGNEAQALAMLPEERPFSLPDHVREPLMADPNV